METEFLLEVQALSVTRNYRPIFEPLSLTLKNGDSIFLQGRNGAGKTTSLRAISGISQRYQGAIFLNGEERRELLHFYSKSILYIGHALSLNLDLTARENLKFMLSLRGVLVNANALTDAFSVLGLPLEDRPVRYLSAGQKRRVILARLWLESSPIWILDEPFTALDIDSVALLEQKMQSHCQQGGGIIFTSHQMPATKSYNQTITIKGVSNDV